MFERPFLLLLIPLFWIFIFLTFRRSGSLGFSTSNLLKGALWLPLEGAEKFFLFSLVAAAFLIFAGPLEVKEREVPASQEVRDFIFELDTSGSMSEEKLSEAKEVIRKFIDSRPTDCFALLSFDDFSYLDWPFACQDRQLVLAALARSGGGGGTRLDLGVFFALSFIRDHAQGESALIVVSDGDARINPQLAEEITKLMEETGTHLYWIWIGSEGLNPAGATFKNAMNFKAFVEGLGGQVYQTAPGEIKAAFAEISRLEPTLITMEESPYTVYNFGPLPLLLVASLMGVALLELLKILELRKGDLK